MSDLEFDEIDKAVNSVISNAPSDNNVASAKPADSAITSAPEETQATPIASPVSPVAARRSSGQFMDVVHPSSDMRRAPLGVPERTALDSKSSAVVNLQPVETPSNVSTPSPSTTEDTPPVNPIPTMDSYNDADIDKLSDEIDKELGQKSDSTLETPFISGTKVEKRPLGAFSDDAIKSDGGEGEETQTEFASNPIAEKPFSPVDTPMPAELQTDLLKIEADSTTSPEVAAEPAEAVAADKSAVEPPVPESPTPTPETSAAANQETTTPVAPTPTSIPQQYEEKPDNSDRNSGAIYDTNSYHKALVHPIKKKSKLIWLAYGAIILAVGAGVGAAVFFFVIPLINGL
jgi:hypothetical protein